MENANLITVFFTGLFTGGLTCMAVQGGLLAATLAQQEEQRLKEKVKQSGNAVPILSFLIAKLIAYTILGFFLGLLGSAVQLSLTATVVLQFAVVIFMVGTALNLLHVHPIFRYFVLQPPRFLTRMVRKQAKSNALFAPALLGAFTVFIPCGTTQAMMALAIASGQPLLGAAVLFAFVLGTSPIFFLLGYFATKLTDALQEKFVKVAAFAILLLAAFNYNNAIALTGSDLTLENIGRNLWCGISYCTTQSQGGKSVEAAAMQEAVITFEAYGYNPPSITVKAGSPITLHLVNTYGSGCMQSFTIPSLDINQLVRLGETETITFTAPSQPTQIAFMCGMGMYKGTMNVI